MKKMTIALTGLALLSACGGSDVSPSAHNDTNAAATVGPSTDGEISPTNENAVAGIAAMENAAESVAYNATANGGNTR
jgi:hypothetical protein